MAKGYLVVCYRKINNQEKWAAYVMRLGVLVGDETEARVLVLELHGRGRAYHPLPPEVESVERESGPYADHPGVAWAGPPVPVEGRGEE